MCLAIPAEILSVDSNRNTAIATLDQVQVEISLALVDDVQAGDYVLIHVGYALSKLDQQEALNTLNLFANAG
jgi:hydrogenase expression/formation protein HypC